MAVSVDVGVLTLDIVILGGLERQILVHLHQAGAHLADLGALRTVQDVFLGGAGVAALDQDVLHHILYLLYGGSYPFFAADFIDFLGNLAGQSHCLVVIAAAYCLGSLKNRVGNLLYIKGYFAAVPLNDFCQHSLLLNINLYISST